MPTGPTRPNDGVTVWTRNPYVFRREVGDHAYEVHFQQHYELMEWLRKFEPEMFPENRDKQDNA